MIRTPPALCCLAFSLLGGLAAAASPPAEGPVVLLANGRLLPGVAREQGEMISVRDGNSEVRVPARDVLCWGPDVETVYQYRVDHRPRGSIDAQLLDVAWCLDHGLLDLAARELIDAHRSAPGHPAIGELAHRLRLASVAPSPKSASRAREPQGQAEADRSSSAEVDGEAEASRVAGPGGEIEPAVFLTDRIPGRHEIARAAATEEAPAPRAAAKREAPPSVPMAQHGASSGKPRRLPVVEDPFDPAIFNRRFHPQHRADPPRRGRGTARNRGTARGIAASEPSERE